MIRSLLAAALVACLGVSLGMPLGMGPAWAEDDAAATKAAVEAGVTARAGLPAPRPGVTVAFKGDLMIGDMWAGLLQVDATLSVLGRKHVWRITEQGFLDWTGGEVSEKLIVHAGQDLAVRSGSYERTDKEGGISIAFSRGKGGFDVQRRVRKRDALGEPEQLTLKSAKAAMGGLGSVLMFLRHVRPTTKGQAYVLPFIGSAAFKRVEDAEPETVRLVADGEATWRFGEQAKPIETMRVRYEHGGTAWDLHLSRDFKRLVAMDSTTGPVRIVPAGMGGERVTADPRAPATTWKQAFLKFGFGYHMAREELLADSFHWPLMREHEVKVRKRWPADRPVEEFRTAWIKEFVAGSMHRDVPATRRLLSMTLATGKVVKETDDEVVFAAHANYGGGTQRTYFLKKVDDRWGIWRIDFAE